MTSPHIGSSPLLSPAHFPKRVPGQDILTPASSDRLAGLWLTCLRMGPGAASGLTSATAEVPTARGRGRVALVVCVLGSGRAQPLTLGLGGRKLLGSFTTLLGQRGMRGQCHLGPPRPLLRHL